MAVVKNLMETLILIPIFCLSVLKGSMLLLTVLVVKGRSWMFEKKTRDSRPTCMNDPSLGTHKTVRVKGLNFHLVVSGDPQNPLMLFLHGFPECWYSWRHQIREFNKDYYCVAFDMRGVGETDAPEGVKNYRIEELIGDVSELIKVLGYSSCTVVGHDWGGLIAWVFAACFPELVDKLITMNAPHLNRWGELIRSGLAQIKMSWYILFFQVPYLPEILVSMGDYSMIKSACKKGPTTDDDVEAFKYSISRPGRSTTFLNYYRALFRHQPSSLENIRCPTLLIWGTGDTALHLDLTVGLEKFCEDITVERVPDGDHFIQQEQPQVVNDIMKKFLTRD